jgi:acyl-CoA reductase-like NAD-dependent aldehyde dehydrogenase
VTELDSFVGGSWLGGPATLEDRHPAHPTEVVGRALRFAKEVRAAVVKVNQESAGLELQAPFGGTQASSSGSREQGKAAREFCTEWKTVYLDAPGD